VRGSVEGKGQDGDHQGKAVYVYLPSLEMTEDWKRGAKRAGTSISRYVINRVEESIRREEGDKGYVRRFELVERPKAAKEELKGLRDENRLLRRLVENLEVRYTLSNEQSRRAVFRSPVL